ncbi:MAG: rhomboid family intramembrane serine protease [Pseudomonadota bacterium]
MTNIAQQLEQFLQALASNANYALIVLICLWLLHIFNSILGYRLNYLGIIPRRLAGLPGIVFFSFLHGDYNHIFFNSIPLFILLCFLLTYGLHFAIVVTIYIILIAGILTWVFGRNAIHIGASSLIMGYFGFLLVNAYYNISVNSILIAFVCLYYFGGLFFSIFPTRERISWEGHLFGLIAGILVGYLSFHISLV